MTFTPRLWASLMIEAPEPGSRSTSRSTFAPFVIACSACVRCVPGSPWAFTIVASTPAALNASPRYFLSNCSQRTDDFVSGSSTATLPGDPPPPPPATAAARAPFVAGAAARHDESQQGDCERYERE